MSAAAGQTMPRRLPSPLDEWSYEDRHAATLLLAEASGFAAAVGRLYPATSGQELESKIDAAIGTKPREVAT